MLIEISKYFTDEEKVMDLAAELLENTLPMGGLGFIKSRHAAFSTPNWNAMALEVLNEWCLRSEAVFGDELFEVLVKVHPYAAHAFESKLLPNLGSAEGMYACIGRCLFEEILRTVRVVDAPMLAYTG